MRIGQDVIPVNDATGAGAGTLRGILPRLMIVRIALDRKDLDDRRYRFRISGRKDERKNKYGKCSADI
jgi:hypothetical protein